MIEGTSFQPDRLTVAAGDTVVWINKDPFPHTATSTSGAFDSGSIAPDKSWKFEAREEGRARLHLHPAPDDEGAVDGGMSRQSRLGIRLWPMQRTRVRVALALAFVVAGVPPAFAAKTDIVELINGDRITCEIKKLDRGKLTVKTDGLGTISIEWDDIQHITSPMRFNVELATGERTFGSLGRGDAAHRRHRRGPREPNGWRSGISCASRRSVARSGRGSTVRCPQASASPRRTRRRSGRSTPA